MVPRRGLLALLALLILFRLAGLIIGCFYGPYIYLVLPLGGLYLSFDCLTFYVTFANSDEVPEGNVEGNERGFRIGWIAANALALLGLLVAVILFLVQLGFWSMTYDAIHLVQFIVVLNLMGLIVGVAVVMAMGLRRDKSNYAGVPRNTENIY